MTWAALRCKLDSQPLTLWLCDTSEAGMYWPRELSSVDVLAYELFICEY